MNRIINSLFNKPSTPAQLFLNWVKSRGYMWLDYEQLSIQSIFSDDFVPKFSWKYPGKSLNFGNIFLFHPFFISIKLLVILLDNFNCDVFWKIEDL